MTEAGWTSNKPTEPGWYWFRDTHGNLTIVEIVQDGTAGLWVQWLTRKGHIHGGYIDNKFGEWIGPITPTDRQQGRVEAFKEVEQRFDSMFGATDRRIDRVRDYRVDKFYTWLAQAAQAE